MKFIDVSSTDIRLRSIRDFSIFVDIFVMPFSLYQKLAHSETFPGTIRYKSNKTKSLIYGLPVVYRSRFTLLNLSRPSVGIGLSVKIGGYFVRTLSNKRIPKIGPQSTC